MSLFHILQSKDLLIKIQTAAPPGPCRTPPVLKILSARPGPSAGSVWEKLAGKMSHEAFVSAVENAASSELAVLRAPYDGVVQQAYLLLNFAGRQEGLARLLLCPGEDAAVRARIAVLAVKDGPDSDVEGTRRIIMNGVDTREHGIKYE